jgi:hypothetical protein
MGWLRAHGVLPSRISPEQLHRVLDGSFIISERPVQFDHPVVEAGLIQTVKEAGAALLFFDTLGKSLGTEQSENDNDTASAVTGMLSRVAAATGCTCIFTHHTGYGNKERGRGASAWTQGLDFAYVIKGTADDLQNGKAVRLVPIKMRDDQWPPTVRFRLKSVDDIEVVGSNGEPVHLPSAAIEQVTAPDVPSATADLKRYTTGISGGKNTNALYLAIGILLSLEDVNGSLEDSRAVTRKEFREQYNTHLQEMAQRGGVKAPRLTDAYSKALFAQLVGRLPQLVLKDGKGRATGYLLTDLGKQLAAGTYDEFHEWWKSEAERP